MECHLSLQTRQAGGILQGNFRFRRRACSIHETGNLKYDYFLDAQDPDALLLVETWQTPEDQQRHCGTETFAKLQALKTEFCDTVTIDKFDY